MWLVEVLAAVLIAAAAFVLLHHVSAVKTWLPPRVAWALVGVGTMLLSLMYAFMLGGFPAAAAASKEGLFDVLNSIATFLSRSATPSCSSGSRAHSRRKQLPEASSREAWRSEEGPFAYWVR
jgi:hypothetical protein